MATDESRRLGQVLEALTGQRPPLPLALDVIPCFPAQGLGYSQLNELLLLLGYDRVTHPFFQFLVDGTLDYQPGCGLRSIEDLEGGVERARQLSLLFFGNVKFGFKKLARDADELSFYHASTQPVDASVLKQRHEPIHPVDPIPADETYYLGYVVQKESEKKLKKNPKDDAALSEEKALARVREMGIRNQRAYLVSDHLDVYVATSMRRRHEYVEVSEFAHQVFNHDRINALKLRWFDPTQAYCPDRIDKGLAEALMLKRAMYPLPSSGVGHFRQGLGARVNIGAGETCYCLRAFTDGRGGVRFCESSLNPLLPIHGVSDPRPASGAVSQTCME